MSEQPTEVFTGSDNVFADLGLPQPEEELAKIDLAVAIKRSIREKGFTQAQAAELMRTTQGNVSLIVGGKVDRFTSESLLKYLVRLGMDVEIVIRSAPGRNGPGRIRVAG